MIKRKNKAKHEAGEMAQTGKVLATQSLGPSSIPSIRCKGAGGAEARSPRLTGQPA